MKWEKIAYLIETGVGICKLIAILTISQEQLDGA